MPDIAAEEEEDPCQWLGLYTESVAMLEI